MSKRAFDKVMTGLDDAIAYAQGDESRGRAYGPVDVKAIREANRMCRPPSPRLSPQVAAVRDWEQGRRRPDTAA